MKKYQYNWSGTVLVLIILTLASFLNEHIDNFKEWLVLFTIIIAFSFGFLMITRDKIR